MWGTGIAVSDGVQTTRAGGNLEARGRIKWPQRATCMAAACQQSGRQAEAKDRVVRMSQVTRSRPSATAALGVEALGIVMRGRALGERVG